MAGIYIHIPFCKQACHYCNFHFSTTKKLLPQLVNAIIIEASLQKNYISEMVATIYFGGGTPSILSVSEIDNILSALKNNFSISKQVEITLEANPDDISEEVLLQWKAIGINRLSLGVQSFINEELVWMNRSHNAQQSLQSIEFIKKYFNNYSIDLIFGSQLLTNEQWVKNIQTALSFHPPHISCYALTIEEKTVFGKHVAQKKLLNIDSDKQATQFEILMEELEANGYQHYEISNYAKPSFESQHNSSYWKGKKYLGLGPSAHSFNGITRSWNISNNVLYISNIEQNILPQETETLNETQKFNEYIMIRLRTSEGINLEFVKKNWDVETYQHVSQKIQKWLKINYLQIANQHLQLTKKGKLFADGIAADFFL